MTQDLTKWRTIPPPASYDDLYAHYGNPHSPGFEAQYIVSNPHTVGGREIHIQTHVAIVERLHRVFVALIDTGNLHYLTTFNGSYVVRNIRGSSHPSLHSWGIALDFNADEYPLGSLKRWPAGVVKAFADEGFTNGADFHSRRDPMHFQFAKPHTI